MVCKAPFHIRFAIHDNRSKVFVRVEDNVVRVIAKRGQKILLDSVEVRRSLVTSEKKVEVFTKSLSSDNDLTVASNRRFPAFIPNEELVSSPIGIIRFASELDFGVEVPFETLESVGELVWAGGKGWSRAEFEPETKKRLYKSRRWFVITEVMTGCIGNARIKSNNR